VQLTGGHATPDDGGMTGTTGGDQPTSEPTTGAVTRLGPDSGGRAPGEAPSASRSSVSYSEWSWSTDSAGRPGLPFFAVFLVALGVLLLLQNLVPGVSVWSWLALAIGGAALVVWVSRRAVRGGGFLLYLGALLVASGLPSLLVAAGILPERDGWSTLFVGLTLMGLGLTRRSAGVPFSVWLGGILALIGLGQTALLPQGGEWLLPLILVGLGAILLLRSMAARPGR
jgi:hypothetical protein